MRLIDADALKYTQAYEPCGNGQYKAVNIVYETDIDAAPTIEPKPSRDWNGWENGCGRTYDFEPKHGKWVERGENDDGTHNIQCSACEAGYKSKGHANSIYTKQRFHFCPNCGAKMDDDWEEPEINPCRGCDDYDGRGGCKSHGGCGAERSEDERTD